MGDKIVLMEEDEMNSRYQQNGNSQDTWRRNLGYLVNCRSGEEVLNYNGMFKKKA